MAKKSPERRPLSDSELRALCEQELTSSAANSDDLGEQRALAMDYYLGEPLGNEVEERSQVRTREVLDTVEWVLPSLMRVFSDADNLCVFEPVGPEDEEPAQQESDAVQHVFWRENSGLSNLYAFVKDGLLSKNGILKVYWDPTPDEEREEYQGINDWELAQLIADQQYETDVVAYDQREDGTHDIVINARRANGKICIEPCPPEEFGVSRDARSIDIQDQDFVFHRTRLTKGQLVEMGYDVDTVIGLPSSTTDVLTRERLARRNLTDEREDFENGDHWSLERVWLTECYIRVDRDGDGLPELLCVKLAGQDSNYASGSTLLEVDEVDRIPFVVWTPIMRTHTFYGLSVADLVTDLQEISTSLTRQMLDSTYLATNGRTAVNQRVNIEDLLTSRPGGVVRVEGNDPPQNSVMPIPNQPVPSESFAMLEHLQEMRQRRTGVGDEVGALEGNELASINTGVAALAYDASRSKIELMARLCAELGLRPLFLRIHELLRKHAADKQIMLRMRGGWVPVHPREWRERTDMTVQVGVGRVSRERRLVALADVIEKQGAAIQAGAMGALLMPNHVYRALTDYTRELGLEESLYWLDPSQAPPPPPPQPDYQAALVQIQGAAVEAQMQKNQVEAMKIASSERTTMAQIEQKQNEIELKAQIEQLKADLVTLKSEREQSDKAAKLMMDAEIKAREQELKAVEIQLKDSQESTKRDVDMYKALLASSTTLTQEQMKVASVDDASTGLVRTDALTDALNQFAAHTLQSVSDALEAQDARLGASIGEFQAQLQQSREEREREAGLRLEAKRPKDVQYDADGLIVAIGDARVERDEDGRVVRIG